MTDEPRRIQISWVQAAASALAAVSAAVLLSTVGVAGTIIGAAIGSVAATVGSAVYSHYLAASRDRVNAAAAARARVRRARAGIGDAASAVGVPPAGDPLDRADRDLETAETRLDEAEHTSPWREAFRGLPWRRLAVAAAALFVVAMAVIVTFELVAGRAVSTYTGGSDSDGPRISVPGVGERDTRSPEPTPAPTASAVPSRTSATPSSTPTGATDVSTPTPGPTQAPSSAVPTETASPSSVPSG